MPIAQIVTNGWSLYLNQKFPEVSEKDYALCAQRFAPDGACNLGITEALRLETNEVEEASSRTSVCNR